MALADTKLQHFDTLFQIGSVRREQAIALFSKILQKVVAFPEENKYQNLNYEKIQNKFDALNCLFMVELLLLAGFMVDGDRLVLKENENRCEAILRKLNDAIKAEQERLEIEKQKVIEQNKQRLQSCKVTMKKKELKTKILQQHKEQMNLAKQGIYNVKATVSDRKGTGNGVNSLGI
mmetsp:Transcript_27032/g.44378  ORF Transcript_27032/g.44378 Transcript_27032/m.44378 type:complete len:177 (+) Transcript_27032:499-1029(+)|eukprot:CAMPEP_0202726414 /NCGR_PEP_ID=MMETSP1385-20130828/184601_1 /ASSEMBLY_ACC=CAM_ASM_000861 /TAXON_ID=933848 /ORGANISM="Elphidium margaritaceum" /LENGTH=176 /DNA_ID=CAMNT_0049392635 /DNA_START=966 /DNA_END=1496 /DNA_ORIENTATION=-